MPELITNRVELRQKLQNYMPKTSAAILRSTALEGRFPIQYFVNPRETLAAACDLAEVVLNEPNGLTTIYILAVTADNPIQLANSLGAIGAVSQANSLSRTHDHKPYDLKYIFDKYRLAVGGVQKLLQEEPKGSAMGEAFASSLFDKAKRKGIGNTNQVIADWAYMVNEVNQKPDQLFLKTLVEGYFLTALNTGFGLDPMKEEVSAALLSGSYPIFQETERLLRFHPEYFEIIFGKNSSFWVNNQRIKLFPDLKYIANSIIRDRYRMNRTRTIFADPKLTTAIQQLYDAGSKDIITQEAENAEWKATQAYFDLKWRTFITEYEKNNGPLNTPPTPSQSVDLLTEGIGMLHEGIFSNFTENQLRVGLETIIPKFWPFRDLDFILTHVLSEYDYHPVSGDPIQTISGEKAFAQLIYLPSNLRPLVLGVDISDLQKKAAEKVFRKLAQVTHPDKGGNRFPNSDKTNFDIVEGFYKTANGLHSLHMR